MPFMTSPMHTFVSSPCSATEGYSNKDMTALVNDAAQIPRQELTQGLSEYALFIPLTIWSPAA